MENVLSSYDTPLTSHMEQTFLETLPSPALPPSPSLIIKKYENLKSKYNDCLNSLKVTKQLLIKMKKKMKNINALAEKSKKYYKNFVKLKKENALLKKKVEENEKSFLGISKIFSENQLKLISKKQKKVRWMAEDMTKAFTLRYLSKKAYIYLRQDIGFPLPGMFCFTSFLL